MSKPSSGARPAGTSVATSRRVAVRVLARIAQEGAWAAPTLDAEIAAAGLDARDAALATEIVYGTLRVLPALDEALDHLLSRGGVGKVEPFVLATLRATAYQLAHLSRIPPHAAVNDAVTLVREKRGEGLSRLVNAVGRKLAASRPVDPAPPTSVLVAPWLREVIVSSLGQERAQAFLDARRLPPPLALRAVQSTREELLQVLAAYAPEPSALCRRGVLVHHSGDPRKLPGYAEGAFAVQDEGSQAIAFLVGAQAGERVLDACAGRGGKTAVLAQAVGAQGQVVAVDMHQGKLDRIAGELRRLRLSEKIVSTECIDLTVGDGGLEPSFDRVFVDAPCTGLGTIHRRPEILLRLTPGDAGRIADVQLAIASRAATLVRPGGLLAVAVCSPLAAEGVGLAARLEAGPLRHDFRRAELAAPEVLANVIPDADGVTRIGPWLAGASATDAYQLVRWQRKA